MSSKCRSTSSSIPAIASAAPAERNGRLRNYYVFAYGGHEVWGATAAILVNLTEVLAP